MIRTLITSVMFAALGAGASSAHEIWLEHEGEAVKIYVGDKTGEVDISETSKLFGRDSIKTVPLTVQEDRLTGALGAESDARFFAV